MDVNQYLLYLSHSWLSNHVDLNIALWDHLWAQCRFLVDHNELGIHRSSSPVSKI